ncbi:MAG TPA: hypothetical protein VKB89_00765, partial [Xanthobacteraceae bacterium]|nr:hypothetical protein [Xanthobacteraceae bacterium]
DIQSGGKQVVEAGGGAFGTLIDGGVMEVQSGGITGVLIPINLPNGLPAMIVVGGPIFTSNGGILQLDFSRGYQFPPNAPISGFGSSPVGVTEELDLRDIAFGSNTKASFAEAANNSSGTLTVTDGTHTANLTLLGQYSAAMFSLSSDGQGGTIVTDPPPVVGSAASPVLAAHA